LLLRGGDWLSLVKIITAFTIAHSVTLALAVLDIVTLPDGWSKPSLPCPSPSSPPRTSSCGRLSRGAGW
jgi:hypothetical protein